ncbi:MAG: RNA polymerase sigma-70 factor (ECF subfamily) [Candidatus Azotimanducaceae bacterium]
MSDKFLDDIRHEVAAVPVAPEELVRRVRAGDKSAETAIYNQYRAGLLIMLEQRTRDRARAEDLVHDTMIIVINRLRTDGIEQPELLKRFVQQTAKFTFIGWVRKAVNQTELRESVDDVPEEDLPEQLDHIEQERTREAVRLMIAQMKVPRDREILYRYYVRDQGKPLVCDALDLSSAHFDRVINRARNRFRKLIGQEFG